MSTPRKKMARPSLADAVAFKVACPVPTCSAAVGEACTDERGIDRSPHALRVRAGIPAANAEVMPRPTPGPWTVGTRTELGARPGRVYVLRPDAGGVMRVVAVADSEATANLIATVPDLVKALKWALQALEEHAAKPGATMMSVADVAIAHAALKKAGAL